MQARFPNLRVPHPRRRVNAVSEEYLGANFQNPIRSILLIIISLCFNVFLNARHFFGLVCDKTFKLSDVPLLLLPFRFAFIGICWPLIVLHTMKSEIEPPKSLSVLIYRGVQVAAVGFFWPFFLANKALPSKEKLFFKDITRFFLGENHRVTRWFRTLSALRPRAKPKVVTPALLGVQPSKKYPSIFSKKKKNISWKKEKFEAQLSWREMATTTISATSINSLKILKSNAPFKGRPLCVIVRETGEIEREKIAPFVAAPLQLMYKTLIGRLATDRAKNVFVKMSVLAGDKYDDPKSVANIKPFCNFYGINTNEILAPIDSFKTFNEFFYRKLKPDVRPISDPTDDAVAVSPADCRCLVFQETSESTRMWIKGKKFSIKSLLDDEILAEKFEGGPMFLARLAPQDYHRYHFPVSGKIIAQNFIDGELYSVNPFAVNENVDVFTENKRAWTLIESPQFGSVVIVTIGATMVGSIIFSAVEGQEIAKGDEHGYFAFGGSTEVVLFERGSIYFADDLLANSVRPIETLIKMGDSIGFATDRHDVHKII